MLKVSSRLFPIGYIISVDAPNFNPHDFYVDGNWERVKGRVIVGVDEGQTEFNTVGKTGGSKYTEKHKHGQYTSKPNGTLTPQTLEAADGDVMAGAWESSGNTDYTGKQVRTSEFGTGTSGNLQPYQTAFVWKLISYSN